MKKKAWILLAATWVLIGLSGAFLLRLKGNQRLGDPGVRMVDKPILDPDGNPVGEQSVYLPSAVPGFESEAYPVSQAELDWLPPDTTFGKRLYLGMKGIPSWVSVVVMGTDRGSIHKPQICLEGQGFSIDDSELISIPILRPHPYDLEAMKLTASATGEDAQGKSVRYRAVFIYWFVADGELTPRHGERMWWMARDLITRGVLQRWAYIAYWTVCLPGQEPEALERLTRLIQESVPEFQLVAGPPKPRLEAAIGRP